MKASTVLSVAIVAAASIGVAHAQIGVAHAQIGVAHAQIGVAHAQGCLDKPKEEQSKCYDDWVARDRAEQLKVVQDKEIALTERERALRAQIRAEMDRRQSAVAPTAAARSKLLVEYRHLLASLYPSLNYMKVVFTEDGDFYSLTGMHSMFSRVSFDVGAEGPTIEKWVALRAKALTAARIVSVGVASATQGGGRAAFRVPGAPADTGRAAREARENDNLRACTRLAFDLRTGNEDGVARSLACQRGEPL